MITITWPQLLFVVGLFALLAAMAAAAWTEAINYPPRRPQPPAAARPAQDAGEEAAK